MILAKLGLENKQVLNAWQKCISWEGGGTTKNTSFTFFPKAISDLHFSDHVSFFPFLFSFFSSSSPSLSVSLSLCHSDCRVKLWNYVPGLTPCLPRRVLAIKGRATSLPWSSSFFSTLLLTFSCCVLPPCLSLSSLSLSLGADFSCFLTVCNAYLLFFPLKGQ